MPLLLGPTGGACAITSRELNERAGGFRPRPKAIFWTEDAAYVEDIRKLGYGAAVLADLKVHHTGGEHYGVHNPEKDAFWAAHQEESAPRSRQEGHRASPLRPPPECTSRVVRGAVVT